MASEYRAAIDPAGWTSRLGAIDGRFLLGEATGALGDLGTFVPLVIGLVALVGMDAATILVFAGLANIVTGLIFRIPIAVQPMKAIAALAIAGAMTNNTMMPGEVAVAGMAVGACLLLLVGLRLIDRLNRIIPRPVIAGIQVAVAAKLMLKGVGLGLFTGGAVRPVWGVEGLIVLVVAAAVLMCFRNSWQWAALGLIAFGIVAAAVSQPALLTSGGVTSWRPTIAPLGASSLRGAWTAGVAQLPLTLLNSVFAVSLLAGGLFPRAERKASPTKLAVSVGLMNLLCCPLGAMPVCHGSGGLAGQHRLGARTGVSMVMLGSAKLLIGLLFGGVALMWMKAFPVTVLAAFLLMAGIALAQASGFWRMRMDLLIVAVMIAATFATGMLPVGFAVGWILHAVLVRSAGARAWLAERVGPTPAPQTQTQVSDA